MTEAELDQLAEQVFEDASRLDPLLGRFEREVGRFRDDDDELRLLQGIRTDWALCDAALESPGDTWARRVARGLIPGTDPALGMSAAQSQAGIFEVFAGATVWIRDPLRGTAYRLLDPIAPFGPGSGTPAAVWELRVLYDADEEGVRMTRAPLRYPRDVARQLEGSHGRRFTNPPWPSMQALRKARLHWARSGERFWRL